MIDGLTWSPNGTKIAVTTDDGAPRRGATLVVMDVATGSRTTLRTVAKGWLQEPTWRRTMVP